MGGSWNDFFPFPLYRKQVSSTLLIYYVGFLYITQISNFFLLTSLDVTIHNEYFIIWHTTAWSVGDILLSDLELPVKK